MKKGPQFVRSVGEVGVFLEKRHFKGCHRGGEEEGHDHHHVPKLQPLRRSPDRCPLAKRYAFPLLNALIACSRCESYASAWIRSQ